MDRTYKNKVLSELKALDIKLVEMAINLKPHYSEQLTRESLAATADILQVIWDARVDLQVKTFEFQNGPTQGKA